MNEPLSAQDPRFPAVRARLFMLIRSLWKAGVLQLPLSLMASDRPALRLLPPFWQRLRVELLGEQLLSEILPAIEQEMASAGRLHRVDSPLPPRGTVDWAQSWRRAMQPAREMPVVVRQWHRELDLPENRLALLCLHELAAPIAGEARLLPQERAQMAQTRQRIDDMLERPPWTRIPYSPSAPDIEPIRARVMHRAPYLRLLEWWLHWQAWRQPTTGYTTLADPALEADWLFELLVLFELVTELARHFPVRQTRPLAGNSRAPLFVARAPQGNVEIFYQTGTPLNVHRSLETLYGIPDIVLRLPGDPPRFLIVDAKNYGGAAHNQALYKMLGYLYQYGYAPDGAHHFDNVLAGVLVFSTEDKEGKGLKNWQKEIPNAQSVMGLVLPPTHDAQYSGMQLLAEWIRSKL